jgi:hypothetical protein
VSLMPIYNIVLVENRILMIMYLFRKDAMEVQKFCKECVLSEEEEPCDVPGGFYEDDGGLHP